MDRAIGESGQAGSRVSLDLGGRGAATCWAGKRGEQNMRPELAPLPSRMKNLPVDERGYVVPWFVDWIDGKPEFRAMDPNKWIQAVKFKKCWVCGERLGRWMTFVAGPMCGINRTSSEPPCHLECAEWSARNCPFLNNPDSIRRVDEQIHGESPCVGGTALRRNPGVTMLWTCLDYSVFDDGSGGKLIQMGEPAKVEWYACGKLATREQVMRSIESGLPALETMAVKQEGALAYLAECKKRFEPWLPAETSSASA
jgi:hypothetical protein